MEDGTQLGSKSTFMGHPLILMPFFLKLPYLWRPEALTKLALLPPFLAKTADSAAHWQSCGSRRSGGASSK
jgi:hypothetical protein